jgi:glucose-1-phosphate adenylyltransferase
MGKTVAVIMAGGRGDRMDVLCQVRPKPTLPFAGRFSVIDFTLSNCVYSGIDDVAILTDYQRSFIGRYLRRWGLSNLMRAFHILEPAAGSYRGTADAVFQNLPFLNKLNPQNVLILAGDHIYKMDYREMISFHEKTKAGLTVGITRVPVEDAPRFGTVSLGPGGEITEFAEKSENPRTNLASMGIYVFNIDVLARHLADDAVQVGSPHDFGYAILPAVLGKEKVNAYEFTGYWQDIGTPQAYYAANMELARPKPRLSLDGTRPVLTQRLNLPPPRISDRAVVVNSLVSPGCVVKGYVRDSILSPGVLVDEEAEVRNSVLMSNAFVGYKSAVDRCIMDEEVSIGKQCRIGLEDSLPAVGDGITVLGKAINVPSQTVIARGSRVSIHANTSDFTDDLVVSVPVLTQDGIAQQFWANEEVRRNERESVPVA